MSWKKKNPEKAREYARKYRAKNRKRINAQINKWKRDRPEHTAEQEWKYYLKKTYGMTPDEWQAMYDAQLGLCGICGGPDLTERRLAVDHCHKTKEIRGLLCNHCNRGLGFFDDDPDVLLRARDWVLKNSGKRTRK